VRDGEIEVLSPTQWANVVQDENRNPFRIAKKQDHRSDDASEDPSGGVRQWDYAAEALAVAREIRKPVQLVWTVKTTFSTIF